MRASLRGAALAGAVGLALTLAACGGSSGGSSTGDSPSSSPSPSTSVPVEGPVNPATEGPVAKKVPGYELAKAPDAARATFQNLVDSSNGAYKGLSVYTVTKGSERIGGFVLLDADPKVVNNPQVEAALASTLVKALSGKDTVDTRRVGGLDVASATASGSTFTAWYDGDVVSLVIGGDEAKTKAFVDAYITG